MNILDKILNRRGIKSVDQLDPEEKATFESWRKILSKEELTVKDVEDFCQSQLDVITMKWSDLNTENSKKAELIPYFVVYNILLKTMNSPKEIRDNLEKNLIQLLN